MNDEQLYQRLEAYADCTLTEEQADQLAQSLRQDSEALARFLDKWEFSNLLAHLDDDSDSDDEDFSRAFWERIFGEQTAAQFARSFRRRRQETKKTHTPSLAGHGETSDQDGPEAVRLARDQLRWEMSAHKEMIKTLAAESFEKFRAEERRHAEELAYKQYRADRRRLLVGVGSLAVLLVTAVLAWLAGLPPEPPPVPAPSTSVAPPVLARIMDSVDARWQPSSLSINPGTELTASAMRLRDGLVRIRFHCGADVIIEAPVQIRIEADDQIWLGRGRLAVKAGKGAIGFTVRTPGATVVDYGTEFGVLVGSTGQTETHVFKGQVDVRSGPNTRVFNESRRLKASEACTVDREGNLLESKLVADPELFQRYVPSPYELAVLENRPVAYWRFDPNAPNRPLDALNRSFSSGYYVGPVQFTDGPYLGGSKKASALQFEVNESHAVIPNTTIPSGMPQTTGYTHVMWVRADAIREQVIFATSKAGREQRVLSMTAEGRFHHYFSNTNGERVAPVSSKTIAQPGTWYHVVVLRGAYKDGRLFINGVEEGVRKLTSGISSLYETVYIGTVGQNIAATDVASFKGAVSEVAIYNRALRPWEIQRLYGATQEK